MLMSKPHLPTSAEIAAAAIDRYFQAPELHRSYLSGGGAIAPLEGKLAAYYGKKYALCCASATTALQAIALALDLKGEAFITTPLTYGATLAGFLLLGNRPQFVELDPSTYTLCPDAVRRAIAPDTKAILAVDIFGNPCDAIALREIADEFGLWYIADAAQSFGGMRAGLPASAPADAIVVSFTFGKSLFAGEGGAIVTDNEELYQKLVWWTQHPDRQRRDLGLRLENQFGLNGRIHPLAAVIANASFESSLAELRVDRAERMAVVDALNEIGLTVPMPFETEGILPTFFSLVAQWCDRAEPERLITALAERGWRMKVAELPCGWIPSQASFIAQYGHLVNGAELHSQQMVENLFALQDGFPELMAIA
jgi:perosamine synthetase